MNEVWKPVTEFPEYSVSDLGRVMRVKGGKGTRANYVLKQRFNRDGYACVTLQNDNRRKRKGYLVSRLVCEAFHGPSPDPTYHAAHGDGVRANNTPSNLRWASRADNEADKLDHGTRQRGEDCAHAKLNEEAVRAIRADDRPQSRIAKDHGVSQSLVCMIRTRKLWGHV